MFGLNGKDKNHGHLRVIDGALGARDAHTVSGILAGTPVASATGWRSVEGLTVGDRVMTFDQGLQEVTEVRHQPLWTGEGPCPADFWPLQVQSGVIGNAHCTRLMPGQAVMIESDRAEAVYGDPFVVVPARALDGVYGVERLHPDPGPMVVILRFADEQIVFGRGGVMFLCPSSRDILEQAGRGTDYDVLTVDEARDLMDPMASGAVYAGAEPAFGTIA